jgi:hypothetical protein
MRSTLQQTRQITSFAIIFCTVAFKSMADSPKFGHQMSCCIQCETEQVACEEPCDSYISSDYDTCIGLCNTRFGICASTCELPCQGMSSL